LKHLQFYRNPGSGLAELYIQYVRRDEAHCASL
jgi:hypothetical protein